MRKIEGRDIDSHTWSKALERAKIALEAKSFSEIIIGPRPKNGGPIAGLQPLHCGVRPIALVSPARYKKRKKCRFCAEVSQVL